jgi:hypothetical protein
VKFSSSLMLTLLGAFGIPFAMTQDQPQVYDQMVRAKLVSLSAANGGDPVDCGSTTTFKPDDKVAICAKTAFASQKPFYIFYSGTVGLFKFAYGLSGDAAGNVYQVEYDSRGLLNLGAAKHTQVSDDNRLRATPCVQPVKLQSDSQGVLGCIRPVDEEESRLAAQQKPIDTTLCAILQHPSAFNNKMVRIHAYASGNFEYSDLGSDDCPQGLWFVYGGGGAPPDLAAWIRGSATAGSEDAEGKLILPVPVKLIQDSNFRQFQKLMKDRALADARALKQDADPLILYRVAATFIGRIDAVSDDVHEFHLKRKSFDRADFLGFGQMGLFDAQFVMQSVEGDAVLEKFPPEPNPKRPQPSAQP